jgi:tetratricopeptide (TPR) repeat protein
MAGEQAGELEGSEAVLGEGPDEASGKGTDSRGRLLARIANLTQTAPEQYSMMPNRSFAALPAVAALLVSLSLAGPSAAQTASFPIQAATVLAPDTAPSSQPLVTPLTEAGQLERQGRYPEALAKIEAVIASAPDQARPRFLKGVILMDMNRLNEAVALFEKLRDDFPEIAETYNNLAVLYMRQGRLAQARNTLEIAVQAHPDYATAHENLGDVYARMAGDEYAQAGNNAARKLQKIRELLSPANP